MESHPPAAQPRRGALTDATVAPRRRRPNTRQERLVALAELVLAEGAVPVQRLAEHFGVSRMTAYRDVAELESAGVVFLVRGAAHAGSSSFTETTATFRAALNVDAKRALCAAVLPQLRPGCTVMLDDSSTLRPLIPMLAHLAPVTVITNSQVAASDVAGHPELRLVVAGGTYRHSLASYAGEATLAALRGLSADICLMSSTAVQRGVLYHPFEENAAVKRMMMRQSGRRILLVDASKFGLRATHRVGTVEEFDLVVTVGDIPAPERAALADVPVLTAPLSHLT